MLNHLAITVSTLTVCIAATWLLGTYRWRAGTRALRTLLEAERVPVTPSFVEFRELEGLPDPVRRYLRIVLRNGQPLVAGVRLGHNGTFNLGEKDEHWRPFSSDQRTVTQRPGFDWEGRIDMILGIPVRVHDAYIAGEGFLKASLLGLFPLLKLQGTDDLADAELMRFLAESVWYPTALLPSQGVVWKAVDSRSASGTLSDGPRSVTLLFTFDERGLVDRVRADARIRAVGKQRVPTPWEGRFWNYDDRNGMPVPLDGEVAWVLPEGLKPYWRGHLDRIVHEPALPSGSGP